MIESDPKTRAGRRLSLAIPDWLMGMLAEELAARRLTAGDHDAFVFVSPEGTRLHYSNWRIRVWLPARTAAGLLDLNFHDLKHTAGTALLDEGINIKTAQARLGHSNPQTTLALYAQATVQADREAANRLGERLSSPGTRFTVWLRHLLYTSNRRGGLGAAGPAFGGGEGAVLFVGVVAGGVDAYDLAVY